MAKAKIFQTNQDTLSGFFKKLSLFEVRQACGTTIYDRGKDYYESGSISEIHLANPQKLTAEVLGTEEYTVEIECKKPNILSRCSCPYDYGDICKHIVAVLIHAQKHHDELPQSQSLDIQPVDREKLEGLSKQELINLLLKQQATGSPVMVVADGAQAEKLFAAAETALENTFNDERVMYEPDKFEKRIMQHFNRIRPLWHGSQSEKIAGLLLHFMKKVDGAFDEGYLYINDYHGDDYFESDDFNDYVIDFTKTLPQETKLYFVKQVEKALCEMDYGTFEDIRTRFDEFFGKDDLPVLKEAFLNDLRHGKNTDAERLYTTLSPVFSTGEREFVLKKTYRQSSFLAMELFDFYRQRKQSADALKCLRKYLKKYTQDERFNAHFVNGNLLKTYFDLAHELVQPLHGMAQIALASKLVDAIFFKTLLSYLPGKREEMEKLFKKSDAEEFFGYLDCQKRFPEVIKMVHKKSVPEKLAFAFFSQRKKEVADEAEAYFLERIDQNLVQPASVYYNAVVETLLQLKEFKPETAAQILVMLRTQYKRRISLMEMLSKHF